MPIYPSIVNSDFLKSARGDLLFWYYKNLRCLPWRAPVGGIPNPYHVMVSEFMLQQTTVQAVIPYFERFIQTFPTVESLANAHIDAVCALWQGLGYYSRARNLHKAAQQIVELGGFPMDPAELKKLAGIGGYTSAAIAAIAFDRPIIPIDGNVMRVMSRLFHLESEKGPKLHKETEGVIHHFSREQDNRYAAQAVMELGALVCRPQNPTCELCPLQRGCLSHKHEVADQYPKKMIKPIKPKRVATTFVVTNDRGQLMLVKRPNSGLFSNLYLFPTTYFGFDPYILVRLKQFETIPKSIKHVFSHFELNLTVVRAQLLGDQIVPGAIWVSPEDLPNYGMPSLMHKVFKILRAI